MESGCCLATSCSSNLIIFVNLNKYRAVKNNMIVQLKDAKGHYKRNSIYHLFSGKTADNKRNALTRFSSFTSKIFLCFDP